MLCEPLLIQCCEQIHRFPSDIDIFLYIYIERGVSDEYCVDLLNNNNNNNNSNNSNNNNNTCCSVVPKKKRIACSPSAVTYLPID